MPIVMFLTMLESVKMTSPRQNLTNVAWAYSHLGINGVGGDLLADVARIARKRIDEMHLGLYLTIRVKDT